MSIIRPIPEPLSTDASPAQASKWVHTLVRFVGPGFHPDTLFNEYVKVEDGSRSFTPAECLKLQQDLSQAWSILDCAGIDIYSVALPIQRQMLKTAGKR